MKKQLLFPLAAMLIASPAFAASSGSAVVLSTSALSFNGSSGYVTLQTFTIKSIGTAPLIISSVTTTNRNFAVATLGLPITLQPGKTQLVGIRAKPASSAINATLNVVSNGGDPTVALSETAIATQTAHSVALTWKTPSSGTVDSYQVERAAAGSSTWSVVGNTGASNLTWTDTSVQAGQTYTYEVTALDENGEKSGPSNEFTAKIP